LLIVRLKLKGLLGVAELI